MSDPNVSDDKDVRPFGTTDWEAEIVEDSRAAGEKASDDMAGYMEASRVRGEKASGEIHELIAATQAIADNASAVEKLTRESIVADNNKFRRRNGVLVALIIVLCLGMGYLIYRDVSLNAPERAKIVAQTEGLQSANRKLDKINAFIDQIQDDGDEPTDPQLQEVFNTVFEIEATLDCVLTAPDDASIAACAGPE